MAHKTHEDKEKQQQYTAAADSPHYQQEGIAAAIPPPFLLTAEPVEVPYTEEDKQQKEKKSGETSFGGDSQPTAPNGNNGNHRPKENFLQNLYRKQREEKKKQQENQADNNKEQTQENFLLKLQRQHKEQQKQEATLQQKQALREVEGKNNSFADDGSPVAPPNQPSNPNENILTTLQRKHNAYRPESKEYTRYELPKDKQPKNKKKSIRPFRLKDSVAYQKNSQLPQDVLVKMENALGEDFSDVKIKKDAKEATKAGARAFAHGNKIYFAPGEYKPHSKKGQELIGHELAHVKQQREGRVKPTTQTGEGMAVNNDEHLEQEAVKIGKQAAAGNTQNNVDSPEKTAKTLQGNTAQLSPKKFIKNTVENAKGKVKDVKETIDKNTSEDGITSITLFGVDLKIDIDTKSGSASKPLGIQLIPGFKATGIEAIITEGAFTSGKLSVECTFLSEAELSLDINANGEVSLNFSIDTDFFNLPTTINAAISPEGVAGNIIVDIPKGHAFADNLVSTGGSISYSLSMGEGLFLGNIGVKTVDGFATGSAFIQVDSRTSIWSGSASVLSELPVELNIASGVTLTIPAGMELNIGFGPDGTNVDGSTEVTTSVSMETKGGLQAAGLVDLSLKLGPNGISLAPNKIRLAITGGLNAPDIEETLQEHHMTPDVDAGAILTLIFGAKGLSSVELEATGGISSKERRIGELSFAGQAKLDPFTFSGVFHATTKATFNIVEGDKFTTSLLPGSQFFLYMDEGGVSNVDASIGFELLKQEQAIASLKLIGMLPRGQGFSLKTTLELLKKLQLTSLEDSKYALALLPSSALGATLSDGALESIDGVFAMEMGDKNGLLAAGSLDGSLSFCGSDQKAALETDAATADLLRDIVIQLGSGKITIVKGANVDLAFTDGNLTKIGGFIDAKYEDNGTTVELVAEVDYDPHNKMLRSLDAALETESDFLLFGGALIISDLSGGLSIRNNEVIVIGGEANLAATIGDFELAGGANLTWSNLEEGDNFIGSGWLEFTWFSDGEHRYLMGEVSASIDGDKFDLYGAIEMGLMKGLTGEASISMDQEMDPIISASLTYGATIVEASELWAMEFGFSITIPIYPAIIGIEAGLLFGIAINTRPLMVFGTAGIENWRPKSKGMPDFYAKLQATWGIDLNALLMGYVGVIVGLADVLNLSGGVRAGVELNIPIEIAPFISLYGGEEGIWGEMGIGLSIEPILKLLVEAYLSYDLLGIWDGEKIWGLVDQEIGDLGEIAWMGSFAFGDKQEPSEKETPQVEKFTPTGKPVTAPENLDENSDLGIGDKENEPESEVGMGGLSDALTVPSEDEQKEPDTAGFGSQVSEIGAYADGIAAVGGLVMVIVDGFKAFIDGGPIKLILWVVFEKPDKAEMNKKREDVAKFRVNLGEMVKKGSLIDRFLGVLSGDYGFGAILNKSKPFHYMVDDGLHKDEDIGVRADICSGLMKGHTGGKDRKRLLKVLDYTKKKDGNSAVREMVWKSGGRKHWEGNFRKRGKKRKKLNRFFNAAFGKNGDGRGRTSHTVEPGATVNRKGKSWEELAKEAYGHESYVIYIKATRVNKDPKDKEVYLPDWGYVISKMLGGKELKAKRYALPGKIEYTHRNESFGIITLGAYGDGKLTWRLKEHNPSILEVKEGDQITLPSKENLGSPWIEVAPVPIGETGFTIWVAPDEQKLPVMWVGTPDQMVKDIATQASLSEEAKDAASQLAANANLTAETTQEQAANAVARSISLLDFLFANNLASQGQEEGGAIPLDQAKPGDTVSSENADLKYIADLIYGHQGRSAWITAFQTGTVSNNEQNKLLRLPQWEEMHAMDPLPAENRGIAPESILLVIEGDSWGGFAVKAFGEWSLAANLSDFSANAGKKLAAGTQITIPAQNLLDANAAATNPSNNTEEKDKEKSDQGTKEENNNEVANPPSTGERILEPGTTAIIEAGDTWSGLAKAAYNDFSLFVRLSNHSANAVVKALPVGVIVTLPTVEDLMKVPEFGLGLSPTGKPLLTEMVRIVCIDENHHVWAEDHGEESKEKAVWMMASTPEALTVLIPKWKNQFAGLPKLEAAVGEAEKTSKAEPDKAAVNIKAFEDIGNEMEEEKETRLDPGGRAIVYDHTFTINNVTSKFKISLTAKGGNVAQKGSTESVDIGLGEVKAKESVLTRKITGSTKDRTFDMAKSIGTTFFTGGLQFDVIDWLEISGESKILDVKIDSLGDINFDLVQFVIKAKGTAPDKWLESKGFDFLASMYEVSVGVDFVFKVTKKEKELLKRILNSQLIIKEKFEKIIEKENKIKELEEANKKTDKNKNKHNKKANKKSQSGNQSNKKPTGANNKIKTKKANIEKLRHEIKGLKGEIKKANNVIKDKTKLITSTVGKLAIKTMNNVAAQAMKRLLLKFVPGINLISLLSDIADLAYLLYEHHQLEPGELGDGNGAGRIEEKTSDTGVGEKDPDQKESQSESENNNDDFQHDPGAIVSKPPEDNLKQLNKQATKLIEALNVTTSSIETADIADVEKLNELLPDDYAGGKLNMLINLFETGKIPVLNIKDLVTRLIQVETMIDLGINPFEGTGSGVPITSSSQADKVGDYEEAIKPDTLVNNTEEGGTVVVVDGTPETTSPSPTVINARESKEAGNGSPGGPFNVQWQFNSDNFYKKNNRYKITAKFSFTDQVYLVQGLQLKVASTIDGRVTFIFEKNYEFTMKGSSYVYSKGTTYTREFK